MIWQFLIPPFSSCVRRKNGRALRESGRGRGSRRRGKRAGPQFVFLTFWVRPAPFCPFFARVHIALADSQATMACVHARGFVPLVNYVSLGPQAVCDIVHPLIVCCQRRLFLFLGHRFGHHLRAEAKRVRWCSGHAFAVYTSIRWYCFKALHTNPCDLFCCATKFFSLIMFAFRSYAY